MSRGPCAHNLYLHICGAGSKFSRFINLWVLCPICSYRWTGPGQHQWIEKNGYLWGSEWRDQKMSSRPIPRLFSRPKFSRPRPRLYFETKYFRDRYRDFISRPNVFEADTETFFETKCFRDRYRDFFSRPNVFETDTETFLRPNFFETDTETFAKVKK